MSSLWYNLSDAQHMSMARIKLMGNAKYFWKFVVRDVDLRNEMRDILKNKYVPYHYIDDLLDQFLNLS